MTPYAEVPVAHVQIRSTPRVTRKPDGSELTEASVHFVTVYQDDDGTGPKRYTRGYHRTELDGKLGSVFDSWSDERPSTADHWVAVAARQLAEAEEAVREREDRGFDGARIRVGDRVELHPDSTRRMSVNAVAGTVIGRKPTTEDRFILRLDATGERRWSSPARYLRRID